MALKLVQSWSLVALFMPVSPLLDERSYQAWRYRRQSYMPVWDKASIGHVLGPVKCGVYRPVMRRPQTEHSATRAA